MLTLSTVSMTTAAALRFCQRDIYPMLYSGLLSGAYKEFGTGWCVQLALTWHWGPYQEQILTREPEPTETRKHFSEGLCNEGHI